MTITATPARQHAFAGTATMVRLIARRDRIRLPIWITALALATTGTVFNFQDTYPTAQDRAAAVILTDMPAMVGMVGRNYSAGEYTYGVMLGHQMFVFTAVAFGIMSILTVIRHTRAEEEAGRAELVRANVLGRHSQLAATMIVVVLANLLAGILTAAGVLATGLESITASGSFLYGLALALVGTVFGGAAAVAAQVTEHTRGASGLAFLALGGAYATRAVGDMGDNFLSWASPLYWGQAARPFASDQRWWPLILAVALAAALTVSAFFLSTRRDVGAGLRRPKLGAETASPTLLSSLGLAVRLHRAAAIAWIGALTVFGLVYGTLLSGAEEMFDRISTLTEMLRDIPGATLVDSWVSMIVSFLAMIASLYAVMAVSRLRSEELTGRAEPLLSTAVSRTRWMGSHLVVAFTASAAATVLAAAGLGIGGAYVTNDSEFALRVIAAGFVYVPAVWVAVGFAAALYGLAPALTSAAWALPAYSIIVIYMGQIFGFPEAMSNYSPFGHVPALPGAEMNWLPVLILLALTAVLTTAGLIGFRRRDLQSK
ncbi:ABC transporter permease [Hoyosella rhizosphaerae]|uniref:Tetronasin ABC transporter integral membrane protein n=1 Tax=Hoyosella rhizosphaerae TaxID=1755582 RepID=A0A916XG47_9ACTN|nr:ABC transporter permease [Hoyosella rhizosphaerae]MBN4925772.1 ABC transporter permease [Hoyosella rhizosphaerae]GGC68077.1 tetronasin ABC transporter integral membrane protein [Hoyosella rhizosphaerae]